MEKTVVYNEEAIERDAFIKALKDVGDAWLINKKHLRMFYSLSVEHARMFAKEGIYTIVDGDGVQSTTMDWNQPERKMLYITEGRTLEEQYNEYGMCISKKIYDAKGVRML